MTIYICTAAAYRCVCILKFQRQARTTTIVTLLCALHRSVRPTLRLFDEVLIMFRKLENVDSYFFRANILY